MKSIKRHFFLLPISVILIFSCTIPGADPENPADPEIPSGPQTYSIGQIRQGVVPYGTEVVIADVVVTSPLSNGNQQFFVQDSVEPEWAGIQIYNSTGQALAVSSGDIVTVTGVYSEYFNQSQISIDDLNDIDITGSGASIAPLMITSDYNDPANRSVTEQYEGMLVCFENFTADSPSDEAGYTDLGNHVLVDDMFFDYPVPADNTSYSSITGVLVYMFDEFRIAPRSAADIVSP
jgi:hypothetical protein